MSKVVRNVNDLSDDEQNQLDGAVMLDGEDLDTAILGVSTNHKGELVLVYSFELLVEHFTKEFGEPNQDPADLENSAEFTAIEHLHYNMLRAVPYMGQRAPYIVSEIPPEEEDEEFSAYEVLLMGGTRYLVDAGPLDPLQEAEDRKAYLKRFDVM